jgi:ParB family chromosome partitioning protein
VADFNIAREKILASERAKAFKLRYDAMKRQGQRTDLTSGGFDQKLSGKTSRKELAEIVGMTEREVRNYLNINLLIPEILQMVDEEKIALTPASDLSYLKVHEQRSLFGVMESDEQTPSSAQALKLKELSKNGELNEEAILSIMSTEKPNQAEQFKIPMEKISKFFPDGTTKEKIHETIVKALELLRQKEKVRDNDAR